MAHLLLMPITGVGTEADPRRPKYRDQISGDWTMCDGGNYCTVWCDLTPAALAIITANTDVVEIGTNTLDVAPNAIAASAASALLKGLTVPVGATSRQISRIALEAQQPSLVGKAITFGIGTGKVTI